MNIKSLVCFIALALSAGGLAAAERVSSPNGEVAAEFTLEAGGVPAYTANYLGRPLLLASRLGFEPDLLGGFAIVGHTESSRDTTWHNALGERSTVPDRYHELKVSLVQASTGRKMQITLRAYDEGLALQYTFPTQAAATFQFTGERTEFRFPTDTEGYEEHGTEGEYRRARIPDMADYGERPLTLVLPDGRFAAVAEADNTSFPRMLLSPSRARLGALVSALGGTSSNLDSKEFGQRHDPNATLQAGESSPWRFVVVGRRPGDLLERSYMILNLNPPSALRDTAWIQPGQAMRDTTLTTANSKAIIDFAPRAGIRYVLLDWKWYGPVEYEAAGEVKVRAPDLDIPEIVRYGRERNVGLILYVDRRQVKRDRDHIFEMFEQWGVRGAKIGFVDVGPQAETAWITETIEHAAAHHLVLDIHDGYRATGGSRTYPNLLTVEGVRGNEHFPTAEHNCTLPFTRYVSGAADYTICYYDHRLKTTHAHQLAMAVISFSPLQSIFWYDKPSDYHGEPEVEFFRELPTVWDETRVLNGEIGEFATVARRRGDDWFVGTVNGATARTLTVSLGFLPPGRKYIAHVYRDDPGVATRTHVRVATEPVDATRVLDVPLAVAGGQALWVTPAGG